MKKILFITTLFILLFSLGSQAQKSASLSMVNSFKPHEGRAVYLNLKGEKNLQYWKKDYFKIEMEVHSNLDNVGTLRYVSKEGRFDIAFAKEVFSTEVSMPNIRKEITVNGKSYEEKIIFKIYAPEGMIVHCSQNVEELITAVH